MIPLAVACLAFASGATAQSPVGQEFRVNTTTSQSQFRPRVAMDAEGEFTVVWEDWVAYPNRRVAAQRYSSAGTPLGVETVVSTASIASHPDIATDPSGNFIVVWQDYGDGSGYGVQARRQSPSGTMGPVFRVNSYTQGSQIEPAVAEAPGGTALAVWADTSLIGIKARVVPPSGHVAGFEFAVSGAAGNPRNPAVAYLPGSGRYVVAWGGGTIHTIKARLVDPGAQAPVGDEFVVSSGTIPNQFVPAVAGRADGSFVIAWQDGGAGAGHVKYRLFNEFGVPLSDDMTVPGAGVKGLPRIAMAEQGDFIIVWNDTTGDAMGDVHALRFDSLGSPIGGAFRVNTYTTSTQGGGAVAMVNTGDFVVTWASFSQDGSWDGVYGQRYGTLRPAALTVDAAGNGGGDNGVWDRGESNADVAPSWTNLTGSALTPAGTLSSLVCPAGLSCSIPDGNASYVISGGATASCRATGDCYQASNSVTGPLPVHTDATALETLSTSEGKTWTLHIGGGFSDVTRASSFYRFVETLLHHDITGGCGGTNYCPSTATTRGQIAVFLLRAKEGKGYAPPVCVPPNVFADVPETSPFCPWIEELYVRGVVGGCGGGNFCPDAAVSREQMPLFALRTLDPGLNPPACTTPMFLDVPASSPFCRWIEEAARRGIVSGCGGGYYCPSAPVTRDQMAVFIAVTFGLTLYGLS